MHGINLKPSPAVPLASTANRPAMASSVWKEKLESSQSTHSDSLAKLLQRAGVINKEQVCDAGEIAESLKKSLDQVIVTSFLSEAQAELCTKALSYLERGIINEDLAAQAMAFCNARNVTFVEGLKYFGFGW
jgi:hypothetical protein